MDLSQMVAPKSDQQNYDDYLAGPRTVTISGVSKGSDEQPLNIELEEYPGRPFKPNLSMRRVLLKAWGKDPQTFIGRRMTLFGNPAVIWGGKPVGGIEISHLSHIDKPLNIPLTVTKNKRKPFKVEPLKEAAPARAASVSRGEIPDEVKANTAKAKQAGNLQDYFAWLVDQGAPAHILNYVSAEMPDEAATPQADV